MVSLAELVMVPAAPQQTPSRTSRRLLPALIIGSYVLAAFVVTWQIWVHPAVLVPSPDRSTAEPDVLLSVWFMRYAATAIAHGHLPALITTAVNAPQGINLMWNTSMLAPGILLSPITLLAGPVASLAVLETAGFAGSAIAMFWVLRRWGVSLTGSSLGGALFGFSPALMVAAQDHYQLQFAVLVPLIADATLRLATGRGSPVRTGSWLGVLVALQLYISEELLVLTIMVCAIVLLILAVQRAAQLREQVRSAVAGALAAAVVFAVTCGYPLWVQLHGPLTQTGSPWHIARYGNHEANFFTPPLPMLLRGSDHTYMAYLHGTGQWLVENFAYLGWPLLLALGLAIVVFWRDLTIRTAGLALAIVDLISLGGHQVWLFGVSVPGAALPWHYLMRLPLIGDIVIVRISILADGLAAVVLACAADRVLVAVRQEHGWHKQALTAAAAAALAAMIVPIIPRPMFATKVATPPPGWTAVISQLHLRPQASVLVAPFNKAQAMSWQATSNTPVSLVGGYCMATGHYGHAALCGHFNAWTTAETQAAAGLNHLAASRSGPGPSTGVTIQALRQWRPAAVISYRGRTRLARFLTTLLGPPTAQHHGVLGWRLSRVRGSPAAEAQLPAGRHRRF